MAGLTVLTTIGSAKKFPLTAAASIPAARGQVDVGHDKNGNTKVEVKVGHLAKSANLTPPGAAYVVWLKERDAEQLNQSLLNQAKQLFVASRQDR